MMLIVPSTALVTYARAVVRRDRDEARLLADGNFGEQLRGIGAVGVAHADDRDAGLLAIHHHRALVVAGERDAGRARLAEQQLVAHQRFVGADERAVERGRERGDGGVRAEGGRARREIQRFRAGDGGADRGVRGGVDLEAVADVAVGVEQHQQAQQVGEIDVAVRGLHLVEIVQAEGDDAGGVGRRGAADGDAVRGAADEEVDLAAFDELELADVAR